jgi:hypothetical protein
MARHDKTLPARRTRAVDDSLLIRSAESLGRMIGALQRQLDGATRTLPGANDLARLAGVNRRDAASRPAGKNGAAKSTPKKRSAAKRTAPATTRATRTAATTTRPSATKPPAGRTTTARAPRAARGRTTAARRRAGAGTPTKTGSRKR